MWLGSEFQRRAFIALGVRLINIAVGVLQNVDFAIVVASWFDIDLISGHDRIGLVNIGFSHFDVVVVGIMLCIEFVRGVILNFVPLTELLDDLIGVCFADVLAVSIDKTAGTSRGKVNNKSGSKYRYFQFVPAYLLTWFIVLTFLDNERSLTETLGQFNIYLEQ